MPDDPPNDIRGAVLHGDRVTIRTVEAADTQRLVEFRTSPAVARWWHPPAPDWPMNQTGTRRYTVLLDDRIIGFVQWYANDDEDCRHAGIDLFLDGEVHGQGLGRDVVTTMVRFLVDDAGHHRIVIDPAADNQRAIACYRACGFREVGVMRCYERDPRTDTWHDGLLMEYVVAPPLVRQPSGRHGGEGGEVVRGPTRR